MRNKKEIRGLVAEGLIQVAAESAIEYAEVSTDVDTLNGLITLQADLISFQKLWSSNLISFEEFSRTQARITHNLLNRIDELPEEPTPRAKKRRVKETRLKWLIFYLFILAKILVIGWTVFNWSTKGFLNNEAFSLLNAMFPGLVLNVSIMFRELFRSGIDGYSQMRFVPYQLWFLTWLIFPAYFAIQIFLIAQKLNGNISFELASTSFVGIEAGLGLFMGEIVDGLFRKKKD